MAGEEPETPKTVEVPPAPASADPGIPAAETTEVASESTPASAVGTRLANGCRHLLAGLRHTVNTRHQTDDEIRRLLVQRQLHAYNALRETAREELDEVRSRITKLELRGADEGWSTEQRHEVKSLRDERKRREQALRDLLKQPFAPVQPSRAKITSARRASSTRRFVALVALLVAVAAMIVARPQMLLLMLPAAVVALWWVGRHPPVLAQRDVPERLLRPELALPAVDATTAGEELPEELRPYRIADATTVEEAEEALRRALVHERCDIESVTDGRKEPWGWSARVTFRTGTPDQLNGVETNKNVITVLKLRRAGLLVEADPDAGEACTVRMLMRDPFTPELVGTVPYRAPLSSSISDTHDFGVGMDAAALAYTLAGLMLMMVADSGGGKSGIMLAMAEAATSTRDAVVINLDPVGTGVGDLGPAITLDACMDDKQINAVLKFLLKLCSSRAQQRAAYGWGNKWRVSPEHPAFCVFVDEWPQLSEKNKQLLIKLLLLGRKEAIWFYAGSQFGTKEYLGGAIGPKLSAKMLGACRGVDVTELLGGGALAEGYRADLLRPATHTERNDAGQIYAMGLPGMPNRALRYQVREISPEYAARVGAERARMGLPDVTHTLTEAGLIDAWRELKGPSAGAPSAAGDDSVVDADVIAEDVPSIVWAFVEAFDQEGDPAYLTMDQLHVYLRKADPDRWDRWGDLDDRGRLRELGKALSRELRNLGVALSSEKITELDGDPKGYYAEAVRQALAAES
ncbi:hypothetical protein [Streptomyces sp. NPDC054863]